MSVTVLSRSLIAAGRSKSKKEKEKEKESRPPLSFLPPFPTSRAPKPPAKETGERGSPPVLATGRPRRQPASSVPKDPSRPEARTRRPDPKSQSFSRSYGSVLPTSLTYILLSARGFSPWRPAAVMSTAGQENDSLPLIFKGRRERTEHFET